jgi:hypothetical protein
MKQLTVIDKLKELDAQRTALIEEAKRAALEKAEEAIHELTELGFPYFLGNNEAPQKRTRKVKTEIDKSELHKPADRPCPICTFRTDRPHDRRSHRTQTRKRPFNDKELEQLGMTRV